MKIEITRSLLNFLIDRGYNYCLSRTVCIENYNADISITLTPVKYKPLLKKLPLAYDTFFAIKEEPMQMAEGIDETIIWVDLDEDMVKENSGLISMHA
ncbi:MAG: hypothetical protein JWR67_2711 [Mucilaginibacter sp.]|nr:hypothetical protein [Mucilaginibacter sp.]MDB5111597.1 hypothetical protein [Mucilaginibacter sp.]